MFSIAQRCDQDCLSVIFSFCERLRHVVAAARTCRSWRAATALRQSSRRGRAHLRRADFLQMLQSPLRCHLSWLRIYGSATADDLMQLHTRFPHLDGLHVAVDGSSIAALTSSAAGAAEFNAHAWPSSLRSLELTLPTFDQGGGQRLLDALPASAAGLQSLSLTVEGRTTSQHFDLAPLLQLPHLTSFTCRMALSSPQLSVVRQLRGLTELDLDADVLRLLLADGAHQLQRLEKLNLSDIYLTVTWVQMLLTLPSLTELQPSRMAPRCYPLLRSFAQLRTLCIPDVFERTSEAAAAELLSSLGQLSHLTNLQLHGQMLHGLAHRLLFDGLAAAVPQLHELSLVSCKMSALARLSACAQLRTLQLSACNLTDSSSLNLVQLLQSLRHIVCVVVRDCEGTLSDELRAQLTPPSALIPSLQFFHWTERKGLIGQ